MKIALFRYLAPNMSDMTCVREESLERFSSELVRISEYVDIDFPLRTDPARIAAEVAAIEHEIETIDARAEKDKARLKQRKVEVLSLVFSPESEVA